MAIADDAGDEIPPIYFQIGGVLMLLAAAYTFFKPEKRGDGPLTSSEVNVIQDTWEIMKTLPAEAVGVLLFKNIFELAGPAAEDLSKLFPFSKEKGFSVKKLDDSPGLKKHGKNVVDTVTAAISLLTKLDELVPILKDLGKRHVGYGVAKAHYPVVGGALLATLEQGLPKEKWTAEAKAAYTKMWGVIEEVMTVDNY